MITIYPGNASDFSEVASGVLDPTEAYIQEDAGGMYELTLTQHLDDTVRIALLQRGSIIKVDAPMRESPEVQATAPSGTVTRQIYICITACKLRKKASTSSKALKKIKTNTEMIRVSTSGSWSKVILLKGGKSGWVQSNKITYSRTETDHVEGDSPGEIVTVEQCREQLFRIYKISTISEDRSVTIQARHISYDLTGCIVSECVYDGVAADYVMEDLLDGGSTDPGEFQLHCLDTTPITGDYTGRNIIDIILNENDGILAQTKGKLIRDNYDIWIVPGGERYATDEIRYGKNLLSAEVEIDDSDLVTSIRPVGRKRNGTRLYTDSRWVNSDHLNDYPVVYYKEITYSEATVSDTMTEAQAKALLQQLAEEEFTVKHVDLPKTTVSADYIRTQLTEEYRELAMQKNLHLYDSVQVTDAQMGVLAVIRMVGYTWDCIRERYTDTELGTLKDEEPMVYGIQLARGTIEPEQLSKRVNDMIDNGAIAEIARIEAMLNALEDKVDGKTTTWFGEEPDDPDLGDIWYDTDNARIKRWTAGGWNDITTAALYEALQEAGEAADLADSKIVTYAQASVPSGAEANTGDLWISTNEGNLLYRYNGSAWIQLQDQGISTAQETAEEARETAEGADQTAETASGKAEETRKYVDTYLRVVDGTEENAGVYIGYVDSENDIRITGDGVMVRQNGAVQSTFAANYVEFGDYQLTRISGGLGFKKRG